MAVCIMHELVYYITDVWAPLPRRQLSPERKCALWALQVPQAWEPGLGALRHKTGVRF